MMRPFWRYYGGKWRVAPRYGTPLPGLPIVEPFAGAAGYATRYGADRDVILVERDPTIAGIWRWLIAATPDDVLAIDDVPDGGTVDDVAAPQEARELLGFWMGYVRQHPGKRPSPGMLRGHGGGYVMRWAEARARIAGQVPRIRLWSVIEGSYRDAPDVRATWFIDPPYSGPPGRKYRCNNGKIDYADLGGWAVTRQGRVVVCEQEGADWLPFVPFGVLRGARGASREVWWLRDDTELPLAAP